AHARAYLRRPGFGAPNFPQAPVAAARHAIHAVPHRILAVIVLVILFRRVEFRRPRDLRGNRSPEAPFERSTRGGRHAVLRRVAIEDRRVVLRPVVAELAVGLRRVDVVPERVHHPLVRDLARIVHHLHRLEVPRLAGGHLLVRRVRHGAARVAHGGGHHPRDLVEGAFHRPEAAAREGRGVERHGCGDKSEQQVHGLNVGEQAVHVKRPRAFLRVFSRNSHSPAPPAHRRFGGVQILLVEDDRELRRFLSKAFREEGYGVTEADTGDRALEKALGGAYGCVVLDVMLPGRDGFSVVTELRARGVFTPVLLLTARDELEARVRGLEGGADDYLTKPFDLPELLARVHALIRRAELRHQDATLTVDDLTLDPLTRRVTQGERVVDLSPREFALLELLVRNARRAVSRSGIAVAVQHHQFDPETNVVDVYVNYLRKKLSFGGRTAPIRTVRGVGYRLDRNAAT